MSSHDTNSDVEADDRSVSDQRSAMSAAFGTEGDPNKRLHEGYQGIDVDPFEIYMEEVVLPKNLHQDTVDEYYRTYEQFREHMAGEGRHFAAPNADHIVSFMEYEHEVANNKPDTIYGKLSRLNNAYQYWQSDGEFPHSSEYNPFEIAYQRKELKTEYRKPVRPLDIETIREHLDDGVDIRDRAIIGIGLKFGLRAGEVGNIQIQDFSIDDDELKRHYPEMGTNESLEGYENAIVIPDREERPGNKSRLPKILPLDEEIRRALLQWLLTRPDMDEPWLFLSRTSYGHMGPATINNLWRDVFEEYDETDRYRAVTSHYGRHYFATYWEHTRDISREHLKYMRGDITGDDNWESIDHYLWTQFDDVRDVYLEGIYKLGL